MKNSHAVNILLIVLVAAVIPACIVFLLVQFNPFGAKETGFVAPIEIGMPPSIGTGAGEGATTEPQTPVGGEVKTELKVCHMVCLDVDGCVCPEGCMEKEVQNGTSCKIQLPKIE